MGKPRQNCGYSQARIKLLKNLAQRIANFKPSCFIFTKFRSSCSIWTQSSRSVGSRNTAWVGRTIYISTLGLSKAA